MQRNLVMILACPICNGDLQLNIVDQASGEIITGSLFCGKCNETYPITDGIPNLLPPALRAGLTPSP